MLRTFALLVAALLLGASSFAPVCARAPAAPHAMGHGGCHDEATPAACVGCGLALPDLPCPVPPAPMGARVPPSPRATAVLIATVPELADPPPRLHA